MTRIHVMLFGLLIFSALAVVNSQHKARKLYAQLQYQQTLEKRYEEEWGQLKLEQSTLSMQARIEKVAIDQLHMNTPAATRIQVLNHETSSRHSEKSLTP